MTLYDDPNREAVGLAPIWTGADEPPVNEVDPPPEEGGADVDWFNPGDHTVAEVEDYVNANPDQAQAVLDAELAGKNRVTLVDWLSQP